MIICDKCFSTLGHGAEEIDDEIYCSSCAEATHEANADYEETMATWREAEVTTNANLTQALIDSFNAGSKAKAKAWNDNLSKEIDAREGV